MIQNWSKISMNDLLNHLGSIWYQILETFPILQTSFLVGTFFDVSYSKTALVKELIFNMNFLLILRSHFMKNVYLFLNSAKHLKLTK